MPRFRFRPSVEEQQDESVARPTAETTAETADVPLASQREAAPSLMDRILFGGGFAQRDFRERHAMRGSLR